MKTKTLANENSVTRVLRVPSQYQQVTANQADKLSNSRNSRNSGRIRCTILAHFLLLAVLFPSLVCAQERTIPDSPQPKAEAVRHSRKVFIAGIALLAASNTADAITTRQLLDRGGRENNPIFGRNPSPAKQAGINAVFFVGQSLAFHFTERSHNSLVRWIGRTALGFQIEEHARAAACNAGINTWSATAQSCSLHL